MKPTRHAPYRRFDEGVDQLGPETSDICTADLDLRLKAEIERRQDPNDPAQASDESDAGMPLNKE